MKAVKVVVVLAVLAIAASAYCQSLTSGLFSARQLAMGGAAVAVADDAFAWAQNPAGLPNAKAPADEGKWGFNLAGSTSFSSQFEDFDEFNVSDASIAAVSPSRDWGVGAGWGLMSEEDWGDSVGYGAGAGVRIKSNHPFNVGASYFHVKRPRYFTVVTDATTRVRDDETDNMFNVGAMYDVEIPDARPIRLGLVVQDVTDQIKRSWNAGVSFNVGRNLLVAADLDGIGSFDRNWGAGAEYSFADDWCLRAGDFDGAFSWGAGYHHGRVYVDFGREEKNEGETNVVTAGFTF